MAYTSTTATLAMLEFLAHVDTSDFDTANPPALVVVAAQIDEADVAVLDRATLPSDWDATPAPDYLRRSVGDLWISGGTSLALAVPSAILPAAVPERNILVNPLHPHFSTITFTTAPFRYDARLLG